MIETVYRTRWRRKHRSFAPQISRPPKIGYLFSITCNIFLYFPMMMNSLPFLFSSKSISYWPGWHVLHLNVADRRKCGSHGRFFALWKQSGKAKGSKDKECLKVKWPWLKP